VDPFERKILDLIAAHDGEFSWYQLDRALSVWAAERGLSPLAGLPGVLRALEREGLIAAAAGPNPSQPVYSVTARGRQAVAGPQVVPAAEDGR
jgi:hypothetical protein